MKREEKHKRGGGGGRKAPKKIGLLFETMIIKFLIERTVQLSKQDKNMDELKV